MTTDGGENPYSPPGSDQRAAPGEESRGSAPGGEPRSPRLDTPHNQALVKGCIFLFLLSAVVIGLGISFLALLALNPFG